MPTPGEHKTVQARILEYAENIGWTFVSREEAEQRRGFDPEKPPKDRAKGVSLFFDDLLDSKIRQFNPRYAEAEGALLGKFLHLHTDIYGNREFVELLRNQGKYFDHEENRELDLVLIDYDTPSNNLFEVTEEFAFNNGRYGVREDVVLGRAHGLGDQGAGGGHVRPGVHVCHRFGAALPVPLHNQHAG